MVADRAHILIASLHGSSDLAERQSTASRVRSVLLSYTYVEQDWEK